MILKDNNFDIKKDDELALKDVQGTANGVALGMQSVAEAAEKKLETF